MMDGYVTIGTELDTTSFDRQIEDVERQLNEIDEMLKDPKTLKLSSRDIKELNLQAEKLNNKLVTLNKRKNELNSQGLKNLQASIDNVGNSVSKTVKKVGRWALAIFGVRSAYMAVRQAMSTISQYDEQLATDVEYMKNALAFALEPVVRAIVNLMKQLMFYVGYIVKSWTGKDIFANANKSLKGANKQAKQLSKTLASFDEMNILSDTSGGGGGVSTPSFDLTAPEDVPIPGWIKWIADNGDLVVSILAGITGGLIALKLGLTGIQALGIGIALAGIVYTIQQIIKFMKDPTFDTFTNIIIGIGVAVAGVALIFGAWPVVIGGLITAVIGIILKFYDQIIGIFDGIVKWFENNFIGALRFLFGPLGDIISLPVLFAVGAIKGAFESLVGGTKKVIDGIIKLFKGDLLGGLILICKGLKDILLSPINPLIDGINTVINGLNKIGFDVPDWVPGIGGKKWGFKIPKMPKLAKGGIINQPGRGVMISGAIAGERGREGVIPLTDSQQMALLGEAIGKYITINANITNTMNGRVISRELQKVQNDSNFAFNR